MVAQKLVLEQKEKLLRETASVCHHCIRETGNINRIKALVVEEDGKVYILLVECSFY